MLDFRAFRALTFDCYGTLVDWETGILSGLRPVLEAHGASLPDVQILEQYGQYETMLEKGDYLPYREVLRNVVRRFGKEYGFTPSDAEADTLAVHFADWKPFPDTVEALRVLKSHYRLVILSNVDDDLFAITAPQLQIPFDEVITAGQLRSYKPSYRNFEQALDRLGLPREEVLHVAQSLFHDIVPAKALGIANIWVNRQAGRHGATLPATARPDMEVPDLRSLASLVEAAF